MENKQSKTSATKQDGSKIVQARKPRVSWEMCLAVLDDPKTRSVAMTVLARAGIKPTETWGQTTTKEATARAMTAAEDWLENEHRRCPDRERIKSMRRRLELEI